MSTLAEQQVELLEEIARALARHDVARLALSPDEAARAIGCSRDFLDQHVAPELRWIRRGRRKFCAVSELQAWLDGAAALTLRDRKGR